MAKFNYVGYDRDGERVQGMISAPTSGSVADQLLNRGVTPLKIEEIPDHKPGEIQLSIFVEWPNEDDIILFTRQMYTLSKSGVPIIRALQGLAESTHNKKLVEAMRRTVEDLQAGRDLSSSLSEHRRIFKQLYIRMVRMGEETGRLDESFNQLYRYMEIDKETRKKIKSALRYPSFVLIAITIAMIVVNYFVIPTFADMFKKFGADLPWATQALIATSAFTKKYIVHIIGSIVAVIWGFRYYINTERGRLWWDHKRLHMPLVGSIINRATLARFSRAFAMGSESGLPVLQILGTVGEAVDNAYVAKKVNEMQASIERGESIVQASFNTGMFTPLVLQMMSVGEETGNMDNMMREVAEFYEREVEYDIQSLSSSIEPIMLVFIGGMVMILALGIFLPLWELGSAAMGSTKK
ncbi:MAG: type II secretion system F family protein [Magnetococcales bacterium]|nr:type II secretion system F family protein [Magnetococcales bacterium]